LVTGRVNYCHFEVESQTLSVHSSGPLQEITPKEKRDGLASEAGSVLLL
jgi:hypothetical protein